MGNKNYANMQLVKEYAGIAHTETTDDIFIRNLLDRTTKLIERYIGRVLFQTTYTEYYSGDGKMDEVAVNHWPLISISSLKDDPGRVFTIADLVDDDVTSPGDYVILEKGKVENPGIVKLINGLVFTRSDNGIKITYIGGYAEDDIPLDLKHAQVEWVAFILAQKTDRLGVRSVKLGDYTVAYQSEEGRPYGMPVSVKGVLDYYRDSRMESSEDSTGI